MSRPRISSDGPGNPVNRDCPARPRPGAARAGRCSILTAVTGVTVLAILLTLPGCGGDGGGALRSSPPREGDVLPLTRGQEAESWFAAPTLDGDTVTVADLRGSPVLINLWATWCPPCREEIPYLQSLHESHPDLQVVGVSVDDRGALRAVREYLTVQGVTYTILLDPGMRFMDLFGVPGLPATFLVDPSGTVTFTRIGPVMEGDVPFERALQELLGRTM